MMNKKYIASLIGGLLISMALGSHAETPEKKIIGKWYNPHTCLLYTSDAADE